MWADFKADIVYRKCCGVSDIDDMCIVRIDSRLQTDGLLPEEEAQFGSQPVCDEPGRQTVDLRVELILLRLGAELLQRVPAAVAKPDEPPVEDEVDVLGETLDRPVDP